MGYPYLMIPVTEILSHEYEAMIARQLTNDPDLGAVNIKTMDRSRSSEDLHPGLRSYARLRKTRGYSMRELDTMIQTLVDDVEYAVSQNRRLRGLDIADIYGDVKKILELNNSGNDSLVPYTYGRVDANERYWATYKDRTYLVNYFDGTNFRRTRLRNPHDRRRGRFRVPWIILHADWQNTISGTWRPPAGGLPARMDLGATRLNCRGFCHFGCSTKRHNYRVMRRMKRWQRSRDRNNRLCYWTTESSYGDISPYWLYHILTYFPGSRVGRRTYSTRGWGDVCEYAKVCTNLDLDADGRNYNLY
jgi:hypothetical protein